MNEHTTLRVQRNVFDALHIVKRQWAALRGYDMTLEEVTHKMLTDGLRAAGYEVKDTDELRQ